MLEKIPYLPQRTRGLSSERAGYLPVLWLLLGFLGFVFSTPREARADNFFGTIGIGIAVGTVLGASTLPFYDSPGEHTSNLIKGAEIGAAVGFVAALYSAFSGSGDPSEGEQAASGSSIYTRHVSNSGFDPVLTARANAAVPLSSIRLPLVSVTW